MVGSRERIRDEDRRLPGGRELPYASAGTRQDQVGRSQRGAVVVQEAEQLVVGPEHTRAEPADLRLAAKVEHCRAGSAEALDGEVVQSASTEAPARDEQQRAFLRQPEPTPRLLTRHGPRPRRDRPARHPVPRPLPSGNRKREEHPLREWGGQPVGEAEMCIGLHQRRRNLPARRCVHHRSRDIAAASEHDVGPPRFEDAGARTRSSSGQ